MDEEQRYLLALLQTPVESDKTDYKAAVTFREGEDFSLKLVKHILGFANSGGGHIIVGYKEEALDGTLKVDPSLTDDVIGSYEVTRLSSYVNSILGSQDRIDLTISKIDHEHKKFPIIYVSPFKKRPYFCKKDISLSNGTNVLEEGAIYIRVPGAQTVKVAGAGDWDRLITQCVESDYETFLKRAREVLKKEPPQKGSAQMEQEAIKKLEDIRRRFRGETKG